MGFDIYELLANRFFAALGIPLIFVLLGARARHLIRGATSRRDWYLGIQLTLGTLLAELVFVSDLARQLSGGPEFVENPNRRLLGAVTWIVITLAALIEVLIRHREWDERDDDVSRRGQIVALGVEANLIGLLVQVGFILLIKAPR